MTIKFYGIKGERYGCFSNFSYNSFYLDGIKWKTSEHYFQAMKFAGSNQIITINDKPYLVFDHIMNQKGPMGAAKEGRRRDFKLRDDWEQIKDMAMYEAIYAKFSQNPSIKQVLMSTGTEHIIEDSPVDFYWGCGKDGSGKNMLGILLVKLREQFKLEEVMGY